MQKSDCFALGKITKTHALKGETILFLDVDVPEYYSKLEAIFLDIKGQLVPYIIEELQMKGRKSILKLEDVNSIEEAEKIVNAEVYLPLTALPKLKGNQFYYHDVIGFEIYDVTSDTLIGKIKAIYESTGQDLFAIDKEEKEILIPIVDDFLSKVIHDQNRIEVKLPEGLLDLYLNS
jgi:16S rRNA processing protein RimM